MIYVIGSLKNTDVPEIAEFLRGLGHDVFDDWYSAGPEADDYWQAHCLQRGMTFDEALASPHADCVFEFDKGYLDMATAGVLVLPAGKSGHIELGYLAGRGIPTYVLFPGQPDRYDVMYKFASGFAFTWEELAQQLEWLA